MKKTTTFLILLFFAASVYGQNNEQINLIQIDSTWGKEIFKFPIRFAQNINYTGVEEARFPPDGWLDVNHQNFWSYAFAWSINLTKKITEKDLEADLEKYFDGLVGIGFIKEFEKYKASASFIEIKTNGSTTFFKGKIKTYDRFTTKKPITLYVLVESRQCKKENKSLILFRFSPKEFKNKVWETLKTVRLHENSCID